MDYITKIQNEYNNFIESPFVQDALNQNLLNLSWDVSSFFNQTLETTFGINLSTEIEKVVIGKPLKLNNELHELEIDIIQLIKSIKSIFPKIIIERIDERFTSKISSLIIRQSGINRKSRMNKSIIDKISASLILESYLIKMNK